MIKYVYLVGIIFLSSCAYHTGTMSSNASLGKNNFEIIDMVTTQVSTKKYFGFGGLSKEALVFEAKKKLYLKFPLSKGQVFANISVDFQDKYILILNQSTVTLSADIVQFDDATTEGHKVFENLKKQNTSAVQSNKGNKMIKCGNESFYIHEQVYYLSNGKVFKGEINSIINDLVLIYSDQESTEVNPNSVFHKIAEPEQKNVKVELNGEELFGKVVGKNSRRLIFSSAEGLNVLTKTQSDRVLNPNGE